MRLNPLFLAALAATLSACGTAAPTAPVASTPATRAAREDEDGPERYHDTYRMPIVIREYVPCANGGEGEFVVAEGVIMDRAHQHEDGADQLHYSASSVLQMFSGQGETTGDRFTASGGFAIRERIVPGAGNDYVDHFSTRFRLQMVGGGVVFRTQLLVRETFGEGTTPTYEVVVERTSCQ